MNGLGNCQPGGPLSSVRAITAKLVLVALFTLVAFRSQASVVYSQPHNGSASLYQSSVNGSDYDQLTWDMFRVTNAAAITEIRWRGGYLYGGAYSGTVTNWTIAVYADIANGYQPDIINPPLATYTITGNAGETNAGTFGGTVMYDYSVSLPSPFQAATNANYWLLIQANQAGLPEWGIALGSGGNGKCFRRTANVGDWWFYLASGDTAFTLVASDASTATIAASVSPAGTGTIIGAGDYPIGSSVSIRATPVAGYGFVKWTQNGAQVSTSSTYNFTAATNRTLVANFVPAYTVTASASPGYAGTITGTGTFNSNATVTVTATNLPGFQFVNWTEFGTPVSTLRSYTFPATANRTLVANYAFLPQTAVFDFDTGYPSVSYYQSMPASQSNRLVTAYFSAPSGSWSMQTPQTSVIPVNPLFSGNMLYPSSPWSAVRIQFSAPVTDIALDFTTGELNGEYNTAGTVRVTAYTNSPATPVGSATALGHWISGAYPEGHLAFHSATPFDFVTIDMAPIGTVTGLLFVDNIVVQRALAAATNVSVATSPFPAYAGTTSGDGTFTNGASVTVTAVTNAAYAFVSWVEAGVIVSTAPGYTFTATNSRTLSANFTPVYTISASVSPGNGGTTAGSNTYTNGATAALSATPSNGFYFVNWTEAGVPVSTTASYSFTVGADRALVANFAPGWTIATSSSPGAGGTTSGGGYTSGATANLLATANANYAFVAWKQGSTVVSATPSYSFTVTANRTLTAAFVRTYTITTIASPGAGGATGGSGVYTNGSSVTVRATANPGYAFANWTDGAASVAATTNFSFTVSSNRTLTANFITSTPTSTIGATASPAQAGTVIGAGVYTNGTLATVTAVANPNFVFVDWTEDSLPVSTNASYGFTVVSNRNLVANFTDIYLPPVAVGGTFYQLSGQPLAINIADLIFNDYDADGDPVTLTGVSARTTNHLTLTTNATQVLVPANTVADSFTYTVTDGNGGKTTGTALISIITSPASHGQSLDLSAPGSAWVGFTGVPWYFYTAHRATNATFSGTVQTWPVQAAGDGSIFFSDDFADIGGKPGQAFYRLTYP